jgi:predicted O-methyltransferase YrrM
MKWDAIAGWFSQENYDVFKSINLKKPVVFECGTFNGRAATALKEIFPEGDIYTCDPSTEPELPEGVNFFHKAGVDIDWNLPIDILFIDDDHTYATTKANYEKFAPHVRNGGYIIFHDYYRNPGKDTEGVKKFVDEVGPVEVFDKGEFGMAMYRKQNG